MIRNKITVFSLALATALAACNNSTQDASGEQSADSLSSDNSGIPNEMTEAKFSKLVVDIPIGPDVLKGLQETGIEYRKSLLNPTDKAAKYVTNYKRAVNYGIYGVDVSYISTYNQMQDALQYFLAARDMAKSLGIEKIFDDFVKQTAIEKTGLNKENIGGINELVFSTMDNYLISNKRLEVATLITTGAWVESQYIALNALGGRALSEKTKFIYDKLWEQKLHINNLVALLAEYKANEDFKELIPLIDGYAKLYDEVKAPESFTPEIIKSLTNQINAVRSKIVE